MLGKTVKGALVNSLYYGRIQVEKWGIDVEGRHPPIVDKKLFQDVQRALDGKPAGGDQTSEGTRPYRRLNPDFPLRNFLRCGSCNKQVTGSWSRGKLGKRYAYYRCHRCKAVNVAKDKLEGSFVQWLCDIRPSRADFALFEAVVNEKYGKKPVQAKKERARLQRRLSDLERREERLTEAFLFEEAIDKEQYDSLRKKLNADAATTEIELHNWNLERLDVEGILNFARQLLDNLDRLWIQLEIVDRQRLQTTLFPRGVSYLGGDFRTQESLFDFRKLAEEERNGGSPQEGIGSEDIRTPLSISSDSGLEAGNSAEAGMVHP